VSAIAEHDVDRAVTELRATLDVAGQHARDLDDDATWRLLLVAEVTGSTARARAEAAADLRLVWAGFLALTDLLAALDRLRGASGRIRRASRTTAHDLLSDVSLPHDPGALPPPRLVSGGRSDSGTVGADEMLAAMDGAYARAAGVVARVRRAWTLRSDDVATARDALAEACAQAVAGRLAITAHADRADRELARLGDVLLSDPLSVDGEEVRAAVDVAAKAAQSVREALAASGRFAVELGTVEAELDGLEALVAAAAAAVRDAGRSVTADDREGAVDEMLRAVCDLRRDVSGLASMAAADWAATARRLEQVRTRIASVRERAEAERGAAVARVTERDVLRGRLAGFRAKASARGWAENDELDRLHEAALAELYRAPCRLDVAEALVRAYVHAVEQREEMP